MPKIEIKRLAMRSKLVSSFWLIGAAFTTSIGWLLSNNSPPWLSFHREAWVATVLMLLSTWILFSRRDSMPVHVLPLVAALTALIPMLQYWGGLISSFGTAWIQSLYLFGFAFALLVGEKWERNTSAQCADFIFLAVGIASVVSTGMQLHQWLALKTEAGLWILGSGLPNRYYANLAQPNLLSSLLLIGVMACFWGYHRKKINGWLATLAVAFILFGVVLTASRTAWLSVLILTAVVVVLRRKLPLAMRFWVAPLLATYFFACVVTMPFINEFLDIPEHDIPLELRGIQDAARLAGWKMLFDASTLSPWLGFGWGQIAHATFSVVNQYPAQDGIFTHAHNLVLDLILWNGYPLGLMLTVFLAWWIWRAFSLARRLDQYIPLSCLVVLGTHALLEFPLNYAYFLMPLGFLLGALNSSLGFRPVATVKSNANLVLWLSIVIALSVTISDYFRVETSFYGLRFEDKGIPTSIPKTPPEVLVLTQWRDVIAFSRNTPRVGLGESELVWMRGTVNTLPTPLTMNKLAANLALNSYPAEASHWLMISCRTYPEEMCHQMEKRWLAAAASSPVLAAIKWPKVDNRN